MTLNPLSSLQPPDSGSERIVQAKPAAIDEAVEKTYWVYECLDFGRPGLYIPVWAKRIDLLEEQILSPGQIDELLRMIISETEPGKLNSSTTGLYLTKLIQDSYGAGNNDFVLTTGDNSIPAIGYNLRGCGEKRLKLRIVGNIGSSCGAFASHTDFSINCSILDKIRTDCGGYASETQFIGGGHTIHLANPSGKIIKEGHP